MFNTNHYLTTNHNLISEWMNLIPLHLANEIGTFLFAWVHNRTSFSSFNTHHVRARQSENHAVVAGWRPLDSSVLLGLLAQDQDNVQPPLFRTHHVAKCSSKGTCMGFDCDGCEFVINLLIWYRHYEWGMRWTHMSLIRIPLFRNSAINFAVPQSSEEANMNSMDGEL